MDRLQNHWDWVSSYLAVPNSRIYVSMKSELGNDKSGVSLLRDAIGILLHKQDLESSKSYSGFMVFIGWVRAVQPLFTVFVIKAATKSNFMVYLFQCYCLLMLSQLKVWPVKNCFDFWIVAQLACIILVLVNIMMWIWALLISLNLIWQNSFCFSNRIWKKYFAVLLYVPSWVLCSLIQIHRLAVSAFSVKVVPGALPVL